MLCPYCEDDVQFVYNGVCELQLFGIYFCCHKCKIAMTEDELAVAIRANEDADLVAKLIGQKVLKATKQ